MTLWVSQSASNSHPRLKMSVDSASTPENTSRQMYFITSFSSARHNYTGEI
jgi:hypothetical protein